MSLDDFTLIWPALHHVDQGMAGERESRCRFMLADGAMGEASPLVMLKRARRMGRMPLRESP